MGTVFGLNWFSKNRIILNKSIKNLLVLFLLHTHSSTLLSLLEKVICSCIVFLSQLNFILYFFYSIHPIGQDHLKASSWTLSATLRGGYSGQVIWRPTHCPVWMPFMFHQANSSEFILDKLIKLTASITKSGWVSGRKIMSPLIPSVPSHCVFQGSFSLASRVQSAFCSCSDGHK